MNAYEFIINLRNQASNELRRVAQEVGVVDTRVRQTNRDLNQTNTIAKGLGNTFSNLRSKMVGIFAGIGIMAATQQVISARAEYEKFDAVLTNTFQSKDIGQSALAMITDFAANTPYQLNELTGGFIKLANRGIAPTYLEMTKMGDLAASQGKSFDQLVEAIMDAQTGEFERMKEFGVKASKDGDKVRLTFKGVTTEIANNEKAIKDTIIAYGGMKGVGGSMEAVSKTLGGRLSNLEDQWWGFLVAVGGYGGGILGDSLSMLGDGLQFLQAHLPQIANWFNLLWIYISPLVNSISDFFRVAIEGVFGVSDTGSALSLFGDIMSGVLLIVNYLSTGISTLLNWLQPLDPYLLDGAIAWGIFSLAMALTPIGWIIIGIMAVITIIGMLMKYTDGWGKSWAALKELVMLYWNQVKANFKIGVDTAIYHFNRLRYSAFEIFDKIGQKISNVGQAIKKALDFDFSGAYDTINKEITSEYTKKIKENEEQYKKNLKDYSTGTIDRLKEAKKQFGEIGISVDTEGISKDFKKIKGSFDSIGSPTKTDSSAYEDFLNKQKNSVTAPGATAGGKDKNKDKKSDGIVSGGSKQTNIVVNIGKLQDQTVINVSNSEKGISTLGEKVREELLRALNSLNQSQVN
ncbi:hypothetical protein OMO38_10280 [Chryseobacterium sp. 09-1422]|uniref:Tape measure domain-containing protein n=1 Tax=Chryseobacterium kimseyorum TaxID=2984028 RepID=A0ABT3HZ22_9FLAO|nr:hypothetical protein [Chryseobacterium kimseyorum]MCW3168908.1 hypothetical protein [Chryseobacterium kimseyorum]